MKLTAEESKPVLIELKPKRDLLDPKFNGYKLSLESPPTYSVDLAAAIDRAHPNGDQYSLLHTKLFGTCNLIHSDPWNPTVLYTVDVNWNVQKLRIDIDSGTISPAEQAWNIPSSDPKRDGRFNVTLMFPTKSHAVLSDGSGSIYILETGERVGTTVWKEVFNTDLFVTENWPQTHILDSTSYTNEENICIDMLIFRIDGKSEWDNILGKYTGPASIPQNAFVGVIKWLTFTEDGGHIWSVKDVHTLVGRCGFDYCSLGRNGEAIYLASDNEYHFDINEIKSNETCQAEPMAELKRYPYIWMQDNDYITIWIRLCGNATSADISIDAGIQKIRADYKEWSFLDGILQNCIVKEEMKWSIKDAKNPSTFPDAFEGSDHKGIQYLEIILEKAEKGKEWEENLFTDDCSGKRLTSIPGDDGDIFDTIADLCSNRWEEEVKNFACIDTQLEDCDSFPAFTSCLMRIDRFQQKITDKVSLNSHQWLFNVCIEADKSPAICVRHDVDGIVWQPEHDAPDNWKMNHVGTFSAFGYVQASKQHRKFSVAPPDLSYVAISDTTKHVYLYHQPLLMENTLRNRRTNESISHIAKQQVISIDPPAAEILGAHASNDFLFILTSKNLRAFRIKTLIDP